MLDMEKLEGILWERLKLFWEREKKFVLLPFEQEEPCSNKARANRVLMRTPFDELGNKIN